MGLAVPICDSLTHREQRTGQGGETRQKKGGSSFNLSSATPYFIALILCPGAAITQNYRRGHSVNRLYLPVGHTGSPLPQVCLCGRFLLKAVCKREQAPAPRISPAPAGLLVTSGSRWHVDVRSNRQPTSSL